MRVRADLRSGARCKNTYPIAILLDQKAIHYDSTSILRWPQGHYDWMSAPPVPEMICPPSHHSVQPSSHSQPEPPLPPVPAQLLMSQPGGHPELPQLPAQLLVSQPHRGQQVVRRGVGLQATRLAHLACHPLCLVRAGQRFGEAPTCQASGHLVRTATWRIAWGARDRPVQAPRCPQQA